MKLYKNPAILNIIIIFVLAVTVLLTYHTYHIYQEYNSRPQNSSTLPDFLEDVSKVLSEIDDEQLNTAAYIATHDQGRYKRLLRTRETVDQDLFELDRVVKHNNALSPYSKQIKEIYSTLLLVREEVDALDSDYIHVLFHGYHNKVFTPFSYLLKNLSLEEDSEILKSYLLAYEKIIALKENTALENTGIYYILLKKNPMGKKDRMIWKQVIAKDIQPQFNTLKDTVTAVDLRAVMSPEAYAQLLSEERQQIMEDADSGEYRVTIVQWLDKTSKKMKYFNQLESILLTQAKTLVEEKASGTKALLTIYSISTLLLWLLLLRLMAIHSKQARNNILYENTLRDIELVFDKNQQKKLKRLIENGNVNLIYKFLIQAIEDANKRKDLFLASMSHEIRTPLNGILGFTQLLKETEMNAEQREFVSVVEKSSDHLLSIVNDILDLSKINAQKIELESITFDPIESFESAVESYAAKAVKEHIDFNIFVDPQLPTKLVGDPTKISQVLVNLVSNAIKFTSSNGEVSVAVEMLSENDEEALIKFSVSDTGIGITPEQKKRIFEAFTQADVSTSRKYGGTGLGLSISGKLINLMGGKLSIRSVKDEGSTFYFTLTLQKAEDAERRIVEDMSEYTIGILNSHIDTQYYINENLEAYIAYTGARIVRYTDETLLALKEKSELPDILFIDHTFRQRGGEIEKFLDFDTRIVVISTGDQKRNLQRYGSKIDKILYKPINFTKTLKVLSNKAEQSIPKKLTRFENIHVLVAEDNVINQKLIMKVLNKIGVEVSIASNGQEALDQRMNNRFDMIFMDIEMPVMGGMEATGKILTYERKTGEQHIPIIALTANALAEDRVKYLGAGMDGYLSKPIDLAKLREVFSAYFKDRMITEEENS